MDLLNIINNSNEEEIKKIIKEELEKLNQNSEQNKRLGFKDEASIKNNIPAHKGFISNSSEIKYTNYSMNIYKMNTEDYFYEFALYLKKKHINTIGKMIKEIENFIISYFGIPDEMDRRDEFFDSLCYNTTKTDEEYFKKLENIKIGDLKGANVAMCTERTAVAQNLLTLFGIESYYCMGCYNNGEKNESHCFNIARAKDSFMLLDYSVPVSLFKNNEAIDYAPFQGKIEIDELENMLLKGINKSYNDYEYLITPEGIKKSYKNNMRTYVVGNLELKNEKKRNL